MQRHSPGSGAGSRCPRIVSPMYARIAATAVAASLLVMSGVAIALTARAWVPCEADPFSEACLQAMDQPANAAVFQMWLAATVLCAALFVASLLRSSRLRTGFAIAALVIVGGLANPHIEYSIWATVWDGWGTWDIPSGYGYGMAIGFAVGGCVTLWGAATMATVALPEPTSPPTEPARQLAAGVLPAASDELGDRRGPQPSGRSRQTRVCGPSPKQSSSASVSMRDRMMKRLPVGPSTLNPAPRPGTTSIVRCVYFQYSNWASEMKTSIASSRPTASSPSLTSDGPVRNIPTG